jgi:hypothetical protein
MTDPNEPWPALVPDEGFAGGVVDRWAARRRRRRRWLLLGGGVGLAAAGLITGLLLGARVRPAPFPPAGPGRVELLEGSARVAVREGTALTAGGTVVDARGWATLRLTLEGTTVILDVETGWIRVRNAAGSVIARPGERVVSPDAAPPRIVAFTPDPPGVNGGAGLYQQQMLE